jgi:hypothetical protein
MRQVPGIRADLHKTAVAYFLTADELNGDNSNYWIFTRESLERVITRSHWKVLAYASVGDTNASLPVTLEHDERAFVLIESTWGEVGLEPGEGWHAPEDSGWRWTARRFTARAANAQSARSLEASVFVPDALIEQFGTVTLNMTINGEPARPQVFDLPGLYKVVRQVSRPAAEFEVAFELSHALAPGEVDVRERGLVVEYLRIQCRRAGSRLEAPRRFPTPGHSRLPVRQGCPVPGAQLPS